MTRAQETSEMLFKEIEYDPEKVKNCELLREGLPISPDVPLIRWRVQKPNCVRGSPRIEAAFRRYFHRASPDQQHDSYTLILAHSNVIRYMVCRALQLPPDAFMRLNVNHGSITWLTISPSGNVSLRYLGESGYMPTKYVTYLFPGENA